MYYLLLKFYVYLKIEPWENLRLIILGLWNLWGQIHHMIGYIRRMDSNTTLDKSPAPGLRTLQTQSQQCCYAVETGDGLFLRGFHRETTLCRTHLKIAKDKEK